MCFVRLISEKSGTVGKDAKFILNDNFKKKESLIKSDRRIITKIFFQISLSEVSETRKKLIISGYSKSKEVTSSSEQRKFQILQLNLKAKNKGDFHN